MHKTEEAEVTDIVDLIRNGPVSNGHIPEQEKNFDANFTPTPHVWKNIKVEWIDGQRYICYS